MENQTRIEERWNFFTHAFGLILALIGTLFLLFRFYYENLSVFISILVYCISLLFLYFFSSAYHFVKELTAKKRLRSFDHIGIYLLIAGTYTPVCVIILPVSYGYRLLLIVWCLAGLGILLKVLFKNKFRFISILLYVVMGWLVVFDLETVKTAMNSIGYELLVYGGISYSIGIVFYALKRMYFNHVIWHIFVLIGSLLHFLMVFKALP